MKAILSIIGTLITGIVFVLQWYLSDDQTKIRKFRGNEKEKEVFRNSLANARRFAKSDWPEDKDYARNTLADARKFWLDKLRKARTLHRG